MGCRICKKWDCTESFHSIEEQERFEAKLVLEEVPDDIDPEYEAMRADLIPESPK